MLSARSTRGLWNSGDRYFRAPLFTIPTRQSQKRKTHAWTTCSVARLLVMSASIDNTTMEPVDSLFSWFREMLDSRPVSQGGEHGVEVFGYADITRILADTKTFSSETARKFNEPH